MREPVQEVKETSKTVFVSRLKSAPLEIKLEIREGADISLSSCPSIKAGKQENGSGVGDTLMQIPYQSNVLLAPSKL